MSENSKFHVNVEKSKQCYDEHTYITCCIIRMFMHSFLIYPIVQKVRFPASIEVHKRLWSVFTHAGITYNIWVCTTLWSSSQRECSLKHRGNNQIRILYIMLFISLFIYQIFSSSNFWTSLYILDYNIQCYRDCIVQFLNHLSFPIRYNSDPIPAATGSANDISSFQREAKWYHDGIPICLATSPALHSCPPRTGKLHHKTSL